MRSGFFEKEAFESLAELLPRGSTTPGIRTEQDTKANSNIVTDMSLVVSYGYQHGLQETVYLSRYIV